MRALGNVQSILDVMSILGLGSRSGSVHEGAVIGFDGRG